MPKQTTTFALPTTPVTAQDIARRVVVERGWSVESVTEGRVVGRRGMRATTWPITVELLFAAAGDGTRVTANGKIGGWGPIQRRALVNAIDALGASLEFDAAAAGKGAGAAS